jgi:FkbM family methyltransferase
MTEEQYGTRIDAYDLGEFGVVHYAQWLHPGFVAEWEKNKSIWTFTEAHVNALRAFIRPGDTVIDVGAMVGYVMVPMMLAASPDGIVLAFEPNLVSFRVLEQNATLNQHRSKILVFNKAATEKDRTYIFHYNDDRQCNGGFVEFSDRGIGAAGCVYPVKVEGVRLVDFLKRENIALGHVSFIKIDTEGYDRKVLQSIDSLIREHRPVLRVEYFPYLNMWEKKELYDTLQFLNYDIYWESHEVKYTLGSFIGSLDEFLSRDFVCDMLCLPEERAR